MGRVGLLLVLIWGARAASAQECHHTSWTESVGEAVESWSFDRRGRVIGLDEDNYFFSRSERYHYDRSGQLTHTDLRAYDGGGLEFEARGPMAVRRSVDGGQVTLERDNGFWTERQRARFDSHSRPARVEHGTADSDRTTIYECTYDLEGRPVHRRATQQRAGQTEFDVATHWHWRDGRLVRVVEESDDEDVVFEVHHRGSTVHVVSEGSTDREQWRGMCAPVFFGACSPALTPRPPHARRAPSPSLRAARVRWRSTTTQPPLVGSTLRSRAPLTLARVRAAYPGYQVWTGVTFGESSPGTAIPIVCVGPPDHCSTRIHYDEHHRWTRVTTRDPMFDVAGVSVGVPLHASNATAAECELRADIGFVQCTLEGGANSAILLEPLETMEPGDGPIDSDGLATAVVVELQARRAD